MLLRVSISFLMTLTEWKWKNFHSMNLCDYHASLSVSVPRRCPELSGASMQLMVRVSAWPNHQDIVCVTEGLFFLWDVGSASWKFWLLESNNTMEQASKWLDQVGNSLHPNFPLIWRQHLKRIIYNLFLLLNATVVFSPAQLTFFPELGGLQPRTTSWSFPASVSVYGRVTRRRPEAPLATEAHSAWLMRQQCFQITCAVFTRLKQSADLGLLVQRAGNPPWRSFTIL